jgi:hypothetical protein
MGMWGKICVAGGLDHGIAWGGFSEFCSVES